MEPKCVISIYMLSHWPNFSSQNMQKQTLLLFLFIGICFAYSENYNSLGAETDFSNDEDFETQGFGRFLKTAAKVGKKVGKTVSKANQDKTKNDFCDLKRGGEADLAAQIGGQIAAKVASKAASMAFGSVGSAVIGGITIALGFIGDAVQRNKCKLGCCPPENLKGFGVKKLLTFFSVHGLANTKPKRLAMVITLIIQDTEIMLVGGIWLCNVVKLELFVETKLSTFLHLLDLLVHHVQIDHALNHNGVLLH
jgi:hypothetical protein